MHGLVRVVVLLVGLITALPANAQPLDVSTIDQSAIIPHLNAKTIDPALKVATANHYVSVDSQKNEYIVADAANGLRFEIHFHECEGTKPAECKALSLISTWGQGENPQKVDQFVKQFLPRHALVNAGMMEDGRLYLVRYVIADFGTPQGNLLSELSNFIRNATQFNVELFEAVGE